MSDRETVLIVEDEPKIAELLCDYLHQSNFATHWIDRGDMIIVKLSRARYDPSFRGVFVRSAKNIQRIWVQVALAYCYSYPVKPSTDSPL